MVFTVSTSGNTDVIDITSQIAKIVADKKFKDGLVNVFVKGSTAAVTTIEADENLYQDLREVLQELIPMKKNWRHHQTWGDDNGGSHIRAAIIGPSLTIPIADSQLQLGTWQKIVLIDFDTTKRAREIFISCLSI